MLHNIEYLFLPLYMLTVALFTALALARPQISEHVRLVMALRFGTGLLLAYMTLALWSRLSVQ